MKNLELLNKAVFVAFFIKQKNSRTIILANLDYIKNSLKHLKEEKQNRNGLTSDITKLCKHIRNINLEKKYKRNQETHFSQCSLVQRKIRTTT